MKRDQICGYGGGWGGQGAWGWMGKHWERRAWGEARKNNWQLLPHDAAHPSASAPPCPAPSTTHQLVHVEAAGGHGDGAARGAGALVGAAQLGGHHPFLRALQVQQACYEGE